MQLTSSRDRLAMPMPLSRPAITAGVAVALALVFLLDRATDAAPVQHLYYLPIMVSGIAFGMAGGVVSAASAILLYHLANPHLLTFRYEESDLVQIALFLIVGAVTAKISGDAARLRHLAATDDLTGLHNLRSFEERLIRMVRAARATRSTLGLLVLDVDRLKSLNDEHGHLTGAEAVRAVGRMVGDHLPAGAIGCRYGGDEFVIAVPRCTPEAAHRLADALCRAVFSSAPLLAGRLFAAGTLSISVGAACAVFDRRGHAAGRTLDDVEAGEALFRAADAALYRAKGRGRNQVCVPARNIPLETADSFRVS